MKTVNGKLVTCDLSNEDDLLLTHDNDFEYVVESMAQSKNFPTQKLEDLEFIVNALDSRINQVEKNLDSLSQQISRKILTLTFIGVMGLTSLGVWMGLGNINSTTTRTSGNTVTEEIQDR